LDSDSEDLEDLEEDDEWAVNTWRVSGSSRYVRPPSAITSSTHSSL
jgi:hypothetical protein